MGKKTVYENVIFRKRTGTLTLSSAGLVYRSTDDDDGEALKYRARWGAVQKWTLNKRDAPKAMLRVSVMSTTAEDNEDEEEHVTFRVASRDILEAMRDEMEARKERFEQKSAAKKQGDEPSESMDDSAFYSSSQHWGGVRRSTRNNDNDQDSFAFEESIRMDDSGRYSQNEDPLLYSTRSATAIPPIIPEKDDMEDNNSQTDPPGNAPTEEDEYDLEKNRLPATAVETIEKTDNSYRNEAVPVESGAEGEIVIRIDTCMDSSSSEDDDRIAPPVYLEQQDSTEDDYDDGPVEPPQAPQPAIEQVTEYISSSDDDDDNIAPAIHLEQQESTEDEYDDRPVETTAPQTLQPAIEQVTEVPSSTIARHSQTRYPRRASQGSSPSGGALVVPVIASRINLNGNEYGTSKYLTPTQGVRLVAEAEYEEYAPCPCKCFEFCVNYKMRKRTYVRVYENRIESNLPWVPFCCCSDERCMEDNVRVRYFDRSPNRSGMCCCCIPCTYCGPPVIYAYQPACCCGLMDLRPWCGEHILYAPYNCHDRRVFISCGTPCYTWCSVPVFPAMGILQAMPMTNAEALLARWKGALAEYREFRKIDDDQGAVFAGVQVKFCECDNAKDIEGVHMDPRGSMKGAYLMQPAPVRMERLGSVKEGGQKSNTRKQSIREEAQPSRMDQIGLDLG